MENKKCLICDNLLKSDKLKTCSRQCADELKKINSREVRKCCNCNNDFLVRKKVEKKLCSEECRRVWNSIPENKNLRIKNSKISLKEKYGTDKILGLKFIRDKAKETKLEKYGNENFVNNKKAKETKLDRYNDENYNNNKKSKETKLDRYNDENYNNRQAAKESMIKKYGVGHAMKLPEYQIKQQDTLKKNYGVTSPLQNLDIKEKTKKTNIERYGFNNPSKSDSIKLKIKKALLSKFDETLIFEKMLKTNIELISNYDGLRNGTKQFFYDFKCLVCNMEFQGTFSNSRPPICRVCNPMYKNNLHQIEFRNFFINNNIKFFENDKQAIKPFELDFYLPDYNFAVELNGNYYHSEIGGDRDSDYHIKKTKMCLEKEVTLLHFFEDEIIQKKNIIYSMILSKMDLLKIIHAKKCTIKEVSSNEKVNF